MSKLERAQAKNQGQTYIQEHCNTMKLCNTGEETAENNKKSWCKIALIPTLNGTQTKQQNNSKNTAPRAEPPERNTQATKMPTRNENCFPYNKRKTNRKRVGKNATPREYFFWTLPHLHLYAGELKRTQTTNYNTCPVTAQHQHKKNGNVQSRKLLKKKLF